METRKISEIKIKENVRTDYGDMTELAASIKMHGIIVPLIVDKDNNMIAGHRRLQAAKSQGMTEVPVVVEKGENRSALQIIENIHRKELDPIEEGEAFKAYMEKGKHTSEHLSKAIGKSKDYIERRIALTEIGDEGKMALRKGKIKLGHAVVLARMPKDEQKKAVKRIQSEEISVEYFQERPGETERLSEAAFDRKSGTDGDGKGNTGCLSCKYNGGQQMLLSEIGNELKDECLNPQCFKKKQKDWIQAETKRLQAKKIKVLSKETLAITKGAREINSWDTEFKAAQSKLENSDTYAVRIDADYGKPEIEIWRIAPKQEKKENQSSTSSKDRLKGKMEDYKRELYIRKSQELLKPDKNLAIIAAWDIAKRHYPIVNLKKIFELTEKQLDAEMVSAVGMTIPLATGSELKMIAENLGFDMKKHFVLDDGFLNLHTKDQLKKLAKEMGVKIEGLEKNGEIKAAIKKGWKGDIPKILEK